MDKCSICSNRYACIEEYEFDCKYQDRYIYYREDIQIKEDTRCIYESEKIK